jgi:ferritin-like metal-binding protein YciE
MFAINSLRRQRQVKTSLQDLYIDELKDLLSAEKQLIKAIPKMAKAATSEELRNGFETHLEQTKGHVERLEEIFALLDVKAGGRKCVGMEGIIQEGAEVMGEDYDSDVMDAALISAAQRVEHYEIAAYGTVCTYADLLGFADHAELLGQTLEEEKETDEKLTELSKQVNVAAEQGDSASAPQSERKRKPNKAA